MTPIEARWVRLEPSRILEQEELHHMIIRFETASVTQPDYFLQADLSGAIRFLAVSAWHHY
jgi:hypothetical protein